MPPIKLSEREKNLGIITIGALIFYVFYQFLLTPLWDQIPRLKERARQARLDLKVSENKAKILEALQKQLGVSQEKTTTSKEEKALEVLRSIARATSNSKLNLNLIRPIASEGEGLKFELSCGGTYQELYNFLKIIIELKTVVIIDSLEVSGGGSKTPVLNIKILLTAYY